MMDGGLRWSGNESMRLGWAQTKTDRFERIDGAVVKYDHTLQCSVRRSPGFLVIEVSSPTGRETSTTLASLAETH